MGTITVNIKDEAEKEFRKTVKENLGKAKGTLGKALTEAIEMWTMQHSHKEIGKRQIALMKKGFDLGGFAVSSRDELHER